MTPPLPDPISSTICPLVWHPTPDSWTKEDGWTWYAKYAGVAHQTLEDLAAHIPGWDCAKNIALRLECWLGYTLGPEYFCIITDPNDPRLDKTPIDCDGNPDGHLCKPENRFAPHHDPLLNSDTGLIYHKDTHHVVRVLLDGVGFLDTPILIPLTAGEKA